MTQPNDSDSTESVSPETTVTEQGNGSVQKAGKLNRVIKRMGGRHLIFRTKTDGWWIVPKPYVLISSFRGPIWMFYGIGQIWITHKKLRKVGGWFARVPRVGAAKVQQIMEQIETSLEEFIQYCNDVGIEGTIVIEKKMIEFHWTFGFELKKEKEKPQCSKGLEHRFESLVNDFLAAKEKLGI